MRTIHKFQLTAPEIPMPANAEVCTFQFQHGVPTIWAIVDTDDVVELRRFHIFGTGHELPDEDRCAYVGTYQDGPMVWHLFELL